MCADTARHRGMPSFYGTNEVAAVYQQVKANPVKPAVLRAWAQLWSGSDDGPSRSRGLQGT